MISGRSAVRTRRYLLIGLMLSLMVHLFGGSLYGLLARAVVKELPQLSSFQAPPVRTDVIRLEKAQPAPEPVAAVAPRPRPRVAPPPPAPAVREQPVPILAPSEQHRELARITHRRTVPRQAETQHGESVAIVPHVTLPAVGPKAPKSPAYSPQRQGVPDYSAQFAQAIASTRQTPQEANAAMASAPKIATSHFQMTFNGIHEGLAPGDGVITVISYERRGRVMWYWTHYEYMYGDGHVEEADIPWPFHYGPGEHDPFASGDRRVPIQAPPPSYRPPPGGLPPQLMVFFGGPEVR